mmetsp:Transcript_40381/g.93676  ORF Transcript_40381/g.93676 Transcript_40381/m.93676 type:complete len:299 (-) Transcript_40381:69-965(-)
MTSPGFGHTWPQAHAPPEGSFRVGDRSASRGQRTLLHASFPAVPGPASRGQPNSSKYLAAEDAILEAEEAFEFRGSDVLEMDNIWIQDIQNMLAGEPDPHWRDWPAWKELSAGAQPLQRTLRYIAIAEFAAGPRTSEDPTPRNKSQRLARPVSRSGVAERLARQPSAKRNQAMSPPGKSPLWPGETCQAVKVPLKHILVAAQRPAAKDLHSLRPPRYVRKHFVSSGGPQVSAAAQRRGDAQRSRRPNSGNGNAVRNARATGTTFFQEPLKAQPRPVTPRPPSRPHTASSERASGWAAR